MLNEFSSRCHGRHDGYRCGDHNDHDHHSGHDYNHHFNGDRFAKPVDHSRSEHGRSAQALDASGRELFNHCRSEISHCGSYSRQEGICKESLRALCRAG